jgi:hypothetical protein
MRMRFTSAKIDEYDNTLAEHGMKGHRLEVEVQNYWT